MLLPAASRPSAVALSGEGFARAVARIQAQRDDRKRQASDRQAQTAFDTESGEEPSTPPQVVNSADTAINREQFAFCAAGAGDSLGVVR